MLSVYSGLSSFYSGCKWAEVAFAHNRRCFPQLKVIREDNWYYQRIIAAAKSYYPRLLEKWWPGSLVFHAALEQFLEDGGDTFVWIEADMIRNEAVAWTPLQGVCRADAFAAGYTMTNYERHKRQVCQKLVSGTWSQVMASHAVLERETVEEIIIAMAENSLRLECPYTWLKIQTANLGSDGGLSPYISDMTLEIAAMRGALDSDVPNIFDSLGWVSYTAEYWSRPFIHYDGPHKKKLEYLCLPS